MRLFPSLAKASQRINRRQIITPLLVISALTIYLLNGPTLLSGDAISNSLLVFTWLETGEPYFDRLQQATQGTVLAGWFGEFTGFRMALNGHWTSAFPIGPAIVTAPLYGLFYLYWKLTHWGQVFGVTTGLPFELTRMFYQKLASAIVAALSVGLFFQIAQLRFPQRIALISTIIFGFASSTWTISAQGLWQHGPLNLMVLVMVWSLLQAENGSTKNAWALLAGIACGLIPGIRQTGLLFSAVGVIYGFWRLRSRFGWLLLGLFSALPWLWWNHYHFGNAISGGYSVFVKTLYAWSNFPTAAPGMFFSPSRGFLVYMPIAIFAVPGAWHWGTQLWRNWRMCKLQYHAIDCLFGGLFMASLGILLNYCFFSVWFAGECYGARFSTDVLPAVCGMIGYYLMDFQSQLRRTKRWLLRHQIALLGFGLAGLFSLLTQVAGVASHPLSDWNRTPWVANPWMAESNRYWDWGDSQWLRNLRGIQNRGYQSYLTSPRYLANFQGQAVQVAIHQGSRIVPPLTIASTQPYVLLDVLVQNSGKSNWYGYQHGIGIGEMYVQGDLYNAQQQKVATTNFYLSGICPAGQICKAQGMLFKPATPGNYRLDLQPAIVGMGVYNSRPIAPWQFPIINLP
jgi:hypothetical protein